MKQAFAGFWLQRWTADGMIWIFSMPQNWQKMGPVKSALVRISLNQGLQSSIDSRHQINTRNVMGYTFDI